MGDQGGEPVTGDAEDLSKSDVFPKTQSQPTRFRVEYVRSETRSMFGEILKDLVRKLTRTPPQILRL
jgi:hypothetical protein